MRLFVFTAIILAVATPAALAQEKPNILVVWGDDIGNTNISANTHGLMGYPPRMKAASFSLDQVMEKLKIGGGSK